MAETLVPSWQVMPLKLHGFWFGNQLWRTVWLGSEALKLISFWASLKPPPPPPEAKATGDDRRESNVMAMRRESGEMAIVAVKLGFIVLGFGFVCSFWNEISLR